MLSGRCDDGPLPDGQCSHDPPECSPVQQLRGYVCNRGACADGPLPDGTCSRQMYVCWPLRTSGARRRFINTSLIGMSIGLALFALGGPKQQVIVSPGNVASVHQALADKCSACHPNGAAGAVWIIATDAGHSAIDQNALCLRCHREYAEFSQSPHTASAQLLTTEADAGRHGSLVVEATRALVDLPEELACADCHREHHGAENDLTAFSDFQCQICHTSRFHSFAQDHPPFTDYPLPRRSEIYFDHSSHYGSHFANFSRTAPRGISPGSIEEIANASSVTCAKCHRADDSGAYMLSLGYESMCASCHDAQIWDRSMPPAPVLAVGFPVEAEQPPFQLLGLARGPFDLPPIMQLLLAADKRFSEAYPILQATSWQSAAARDQRDSPQVAQLSAAIRDLLTALGDDPRGTLSERLEAVGGDRLPAEEIRRLARTTATASFVANVRRMAQRLSTPDGATRDTESDGMTSAPALGWSLDEQSGVLTYRPREHADSMVRGWIDAAAAIIEPDRYESPAATGEEDSSGVIQAAAEYFTQPMAAGRCVKCHTVDRVADRLHVNWHAQNRAPGREELTFFRHAPHIVMLPGQDHCITCHELDVQPDLFRTEFFSSGDRVSIDAAPGASCGFPQIRGAVTCASCHRRSGASQRCTTCHHYHARTDASDASGPSPR